MDAIYNLLSPSLTYVLQVLLTKKRGLVVALRLFMVSEKIIASFLKDIEKRGFCQSTVPRYINI